MPVVHGGKEIRETLIKSDNDLISVPLESRNDHRHHSDFLVWSEECWCGASLFLDTSTPHSRVELSFRGKGDAPHRLPPFFPPLSLPAQILYNFIDTFYALAKEETS